jgi:hypothetical protein
LAATRTRRHFAPHAAVEQIDIRQRAKQWLQREEAHGGRCGAQVVDAREVGGGLHAVVAGGV